MIDTLQNEIYQFMVVQMKRLEEDKRVIDTDGVGWDSWKNEARDLVVCNKDFPST
jgi:hypothetical protein